MKGSLVHRGANRWGIVIDVGTVIDPITQRRKRKQKWVGFKSTATLSAREQRKEAELKLNELVGKEGRHERVDATKTTVGEWLDSWLAKAIAPPKKRPRTYASFKSVIERHLKPALGTIRLQALQSLDLEAYYAKHTTLSQTSLQLHQAILSSALKAAVKNKLVTRNVASEVDGKPRAKRQTERSDETKMQCWTLDEARAFLAAARQTWPQAAAFYAVALDSGARKSELLGLKWTDLDVDAGTLAIVRQLVESGKRKRGAERGTVIIREAVFGPPKTGRPRVIDLSTETLRLLAEHKKAQAELKMKNRTSYTDSGMLFAREHRDLYGQPDGLGLPLAYGQYGERLFKRLIKAASVRPICFHGLRHSCASLMLHAGESIKVVQERLGHANVQTTLNTYAHVLPTMQRAAAHRLGEALYG